MYCTRLLSQILQIPYIYFDSVLFFFLLFSFVQACLYFHVFTFITKVQIRQQLTVNEFYTLQILWKDLLSTYEVRIWSINGCIYYYLTFKDRRLKKKEGGFLSVTADSHTSCLDIQGLRSEHNYAVMLCSSDSLSKRLIASSPGPTRLKLMVLLNQMMYGTWCRLIE